ncbi:aminodeoxychorismate synthase component I [Nocardia sp. NPDC004068]|uniref:aminodeoxychorismate synthase component I n=1 Tax=Nocardia sp. NPDC004068 TaxID=3364303 RepID=UPI0036A0BC77
MRTLLVDNYDSFTYNLFHLLGEVEGCEPVVVRNDEVADLSELDLDRFDNVVISPGPGRPDVPRDFGISRALIEHGDLPLLGVCLGHQGIVLGAGGSVVPAPLPRHGYPDRIRHDGRDLFAGVPMEFEAVRYHSLCAGLPLPETLEITATAPDGVIMGVRHRHRPQWGVQFHPESVASEHGRAILANFARLTRETPPRRAAPTPAEERTIRVRRPDIAPAPAGSPSARTASTRERGRRPTETRERDPRDTKTREQDHHNTETGERDRHNSETRERDHHNTETPEQDHHNTETPEQDHHNTEIRERDRRNTTGTGEQDCRNTETHPLSDPPRPTPLEYRVLHETIDHPTDTEALFLARYADTETAFWLDSAHLETGMDRFSYLGDASGPLSEVVHYRVGDGFVRVDSGSGSRTVPGTVLDYLSTELARRRIEFPDVPFDFAGGYVGYLGYEVKADCGATARHRSPTPDAQWIFADRLVVVDHHTARTHLLALTDADSLATARNWLTETRAAITAMPSPADRLPDQPPPPFPPRQPNRGRRRYLADIAAIGDHLRAGQTYEVNLTDNTDTDADCPGLDVHRVLRRRNPAPYAAFLRFGELEIACSSPERFLRIDRARTVESRPIKGTAARHPDPRADEIARRALESDPKTRAENLMIVDLLRNDLGRVCEPGSVHVPSLMTAETYATMHQLVTTVRGALRPEIDAVGCLRACFPGGSMTGAPKLRTLELLDELETEARGIYSGTLGYLGLGGTADLNIVIRTAVRHEGRWRVGAGGAIVLDSDPEQEYREMVLKAAAALDAVTAVAHVRTTA